VCSTKGWLTHHYQTYVHHWALADSPEHLMMVCEARNGGLSLSISSSCDRARRQHIPAPVNLKLWGPALYSRAACAFLSRPPQVCITGPLADSPEHLMGNYYGRWDTEAALTPRKAVKTYLGGLGYVGGWGGVHTCGGGGV
jgi:hypothetical protein